MWMCTLPDSGGAAGWHELCGDEEEWAKYTSAFLEWCHRRFTLGGVTSMTTVDLSLVSAGQHALFG